MLESSHTRKTYSSTASFRLLLWVFLLFPLSFIMAQEPLAVYVELNSFDTSNVGGDGAQTLLWKRGDANTIDGLMRIVPNNGATGGGTVVKRNQVQLTSGFSTYFQIKMHTMINGYGDGMTFVLYENDSPQLGEYGGGLGYEGIGNSIAVEFDTWINPESDSSYDPSQSHVSVLKNGSVNHGLNQVDQPTTSDSRLKGSTIHAWVDYNAGVVTVTWGISATRGDAGNLSMSRNVGTFLEGKNVYIGFSASTGWAREHHDVMKWLFKDSYVTGGLDPEGSYTQAPSTLDIVLNQNPDPTLAAITVRDADGSTMSGQSVEIFIDDVSRGTFTSAADGTVSFTVPGGLAGGGHRLRAVALGGASNYRDFTVSPPSFAITGNAGVSGATLSWSDGTVKSVTADGSGNYSITVTNNWSGTVTPALAGYFFTPASRSYSGVTANQTSQDYAATIMTYTITASAGTGGFISPSGAVGVSHGSNQSFSIAADSGYHIDDVVVDGSSVGAVGSFEFTNVITAHTIEAVFEADPPVLENSTGNTAAIRNGPAVVVDASLTVSGEDSINGARVYIDPYESGDQLSFDNASLPVAVNGSWNAGTGVLTFSGTASSADWQILLRSVVFSTTSGSAAQRNIRFSLGNSVPFEDNGHFYEWVASSSISWTQARNAAALKRMFGMTGYLVTVTSTGENSFVASKLDGQGWMGASDEAAEWIWRWVTGPEGLENSGSGRHFFTQTADSPSGGGYAVGGYYHNWASLEPNNAGGEDYAHFLDGGQWNDYPNTVGSAIEGYVVEYGGMPGDPVLQITDSKGVDVQVHVSISGHAGIPGAVLSYTDGTAQTATADGSGNYSLNVAAGWSGTVTPSLAGYTFTPVSRSYNNLLSSQTGQDYTAVPVTYTIMGNVGVAGATLSWTDGTAKSVTADGSGHYTLMVSYNWTGTVTPSLAGYTFTPVSRSYSNLLSSQTGQDYAASLNTYTISGTVTDGTNPLSGVIISFSHNGHAVTTAADGGYSYVVNYGTNTTLTPSRPGYDIFTPASRTISAIAFDQPGQNFMGVLNRYTITATVSGSGTIDPSGSVELDYGSDQVFTITPQPGYHIDEVLVDGLSVGAVSSFSFTDVTANHSIEARFSVDRFQVQVNAGSGGTASPALSRHDYGDRVEILLVPQDSWYLVSLRDNGEDVPLSLPADRTVSYTHAIESVTEDHVVEAFFARTVFEVTASVRGGNGTVSPAAQAVTYGSDVRIDLVPNPEYQVGVIEDNGFFLPVDDLSSGGALSLRSVSSHHVVTVEYRRLDNGTGNDFYSTPQDTLLIEAPPGVLRNDPEYHGAGTRTQLGSGALHGSLELASDGGFNYTPHKGFSGIDRFSYYALEGSVRSPEYSVSIEVTPRDSGLSGTEDYYYAGTGATTLTVPAPGVLNNDSHPQGQSLLAELVSGADLGTVQLNAYGGFVLSGLPENYTGLVRFSYRVLDAAGKRSEPILVVIGIGVSLIPPQVTITTPQNSSLVSEVTTVTAEVVDDRRVVRTELIIDGVLTGEGDNDDLSPPDRLAGVHALPVSTREDRRVYRWQLDSREYRNGQKEIRVRAFDDFGLTGEDLVRIVVRNLSLTLSGRREVEPLWSMNLDTVLLTLEAYNPDRVPVEVYRLEKRREGSSDWTLLRELPGDALWSGSLEISDSETERGQRMEYRLTALAADDRVLARSEVLGI